MTTEPFPLSFAPEAKRNNSLAELVEMAVRDGECRLTHHGAVAVETGIQPRDRGRGQGVAERPPDETQQQDSGPNAADEQPFDPLKRGSGAGQRTGCSLGQGDVFTAGHLTLDPQPLLRRMLSPAPESSGTREHPTTP